MKTSSILVSSILFMSLLSCSSTTKKETIHIEEGKVGMIGYGSLISFNSMKYTLGREYDDSTYLVHLEGYQREWSYVCSYKDSLLPEDIFNYNSYYIRNQDTIPFENAVFLNIVADVESSMNCVLYIISEEELKGFDQRELGYERIDVTDKIAEYNIEGGQVFAYKALPKYTLNEAYNEETVIIEQSYLDLVTQACDSIGSYYREEYEATTVTPNPEIIAPVIWKQIK